MTLQPGTTFGPYTVTAKIGEGGMGEVYQARDTKLDRDVALKVLPEAFTSDPDRLVRFEREAKLLASLNHQNIGGIYGLEEAEGVRALVLELVEGPTLADRITDGPIPLEEALPIARQIAEALEAAHEQGVIHRDLKPSNVKVKADGTVKVLDFGLAKAFQPDASDPNLSASPTVSLTAAATQMGMVIGTAAYMAPEQAKGKVVDKRADIWAFGAVLYEMLTGKRVFAGADVSDTLAFVLTKEIDWTILSADTPPSVQNLLRRCLQRDPRRRLRDIGEARIGIDESDAMPSGAAQASSATRLHIWQRPFPAMAILATVAGIAGGAVWSSTARDSSPVVRFMIPFEGLARLPGNPGTGLALSPDGGTLVYSAIEGDRGQLYLRDLDELDARVLRGTEGGRSVFWSPDGQSVGFFADGALKTMALAGGASDTLCPVRGFGGASWGVDNTVVFSAGVNSPLLRVSALGGVPEPLTVLDEGQRGHLWPQVLPGGAAVLFTVLGPGPADRSTRIAVHAFGSGEHEVLLEGASARYISTGHLVFARGTTLWMAPFDAASLAVTGPASPVLEDVLFAGPGASQFTVAPNGSLAYAPESAGGRRSSMVVSVDREGRATPLTEVRDTYISPRLSPDQSQLAFGIESDVWTMGLARGDRTRITRGRGVGFTATPTWTPDSRSVTYVAAAEPGSSDFAIYTQPADASGTPERLLVRSHGVLPNSWSPDGETLAYYESLPDTARDLWTLTPSRGAEPSLFLATEFNERAADFSPDGRWLAFVSDASGQDEVYVRPFPRDDAGQETISTGGGTEPVWSPTGSELFYRSGSELMAVEIDLGPPFDVGQAHALFLDTYERDESGALGLPFYDVAADGERFVMIQVGDLTSDEQRRTGFVVVQNWAEELKARVPVP